MMSQLSQSRPWDSCQQLSRLLPGGVSVHFARAASPFNPTPAHHFPLAENTARSAFTLLAS